jgi:hypothetical protein
MQVWGIGLGQGTTGWTWYFREAHRVNPLNQVNWVYLFQKQTWKQRTDNLKSVVNAYRRAQTKFDIFFLNFKDSRWIFYAICSHIMAS